MKISILTLPLHANYGGILQAFALQTTLEKMGHKVAVYNEFKTKIERPLWQYPLVWLIRCFLKYILRKPNLYIFAEQYGAKLTGTINMYTRAFVEQYIHEIPFDNVKQGVHSGEEVIVVGSDQVWRKHYYNSVAGDNFTPNSYLAFAKDWDIKRIAYAPSFGSDKWEMDERETQMAAELIKKFDAVSVREQSSINLCKEHLEVDVIQVLDPTMLLDAEDYLREIDCKQFLGIHKGTIMCYVLDKSDHTDALIELASKKLSLKIHRANNPCIGNADVALEQRIQPPVESWLAGFVDAECVITDSFHACVFSILFKKPFIVVGNEHRGQARFVSLLSMFGLENRFIDTTVPIAIDKVMLQPIDWTLVYDKLNKWKLISRTFLQNALDL